MASYLLAPHVYTCVTDDHVILLDLQRDKYLGVDREQMSALAAHVKGWPVSDLTAGNGADASAGGETRPSNARADAVLARMLAAGMLTTDTAIGKEAKPLVIERTEAALVEAELETQPGVAFVHVVRFLRASLLTALAMRWRSIEAVVASTEARKARGIARGASMDLDAARAAVGAFIRLRPLLFGAQDACLFDSLALVRYLSYFRLFPLCVIGVQTAPFGAHCWVQEGALVFNDAPEHVRRFTPILAV